MADSDNQTDEDVQSVPSAKKAARKKAAKSAKKTVEKSNKASAVSGEGKRTRKSRPYPMVAFNQATAIGEAIHKYAAGDKVRRLTLLEKMQMSPTASTTQQTITNSGKYGITTGSYAAEWLELTQQGKVACDNDANPRARLEARFSLAISGVAPFLRLYEEYKGKKIAAREVMHDVLKPANLGVEDYGECVDIFITNVKDLGLLRTIAGSETLVTIEQALDEAGKLPVAGTVAPNHAASAKAPVQSSAGTKEWEKICFYVSPIGDEGTEIRQHSDLFKSSIIEPAMKELGLEVVRADDIATPGMITSSIWDI